MCISVQKRQRFTFSNAQNTTKFRYKENLVTVYNGSEIDESLCVFKLMFSAPLGSVIINKYGYRICSIAGGFIAATAISLGFLADDVIYLFFMVYSLVSFFLSENVYL